MVEPRVIRRRLPGSGTTGASPGSPPEFVSVASGLGHSSSGVSMGGSGNTSRGGSTSVSKLDESSSDDGSSAVSGVLAVSGVVDDVPLEVEPPLPPPTLPAAAGGGLPIPRLPPSVVDPPELPDPPFPGKPEDDVPEPLDVVEEPVAPPVMFSVTVAGVLRSPDVVRSPDVDVTCGPGDPSRNTP